jgi:hypothetical protein
MVARNAALLHFPEKTSDRRENMSILEPNSLVRKDTAREAGTSRRSFLQRAAIAGAVGAAGTGGMLSFLSPRAKAFNTLGHDGQDEDSDDLKKRDNNILIAAEIAEALAVTTYTNIIDGAPFFRRLPSDDQGYLVAARQEEMSHYLLEQSVTDEPSPFKSFFYPKGMFQDAQTTLNERPGYARRRVYCRLSGRRAQFQYARSARYRGAHHGHRKRPSHARACPGF